MTIKEMKNEIYEAFKTYIDGDKEIVDEVGAEIIAALEATRWIPVRERLPTEEDGGIQQEVLVWHMNQIKRWRWEDVTYYSSKVSHWMPLPEPPKGE